MSDTIIEVKFNIHIKSPGDDKKVEQWVAENLPTLPEQVKETFSEYCDEFFTIEDVTAELKH